MKPKAAVLRPYPGRSDVIVGTHLRGVHLHFDVNGDLEEIRKAFKPFLAKHSGFLHWDDFVLPTVDDFRGIYRGSYRKEWDGFFEVMADPERFGAPQAHLSAGKYYGDLFSADFGRYLELYEDGIAFLTALPFSGYLELEDVTEERLRTESGAPPDFDAGILPLAERTIRKISLADVREVEYSPDGSTAAAEDSPRFFRTTEIHFTYKNISLVHPGLMAELLNNGFYSAYQRTNNGNIKFIATIQGFRNEINALECSVRRWFAENKDRSQCEVVLKREDILKYCVFGTHPHLQSVVAPG